VTRPVLADVLRETSTGATPQTVAARLGLDPGLVEAMVDHARRVGLVMAPACTSCDLSAATCPACPLAH